MSLSTDVDQLRARHNRITVNLSHTNPSGALTTIQAKLQRTGSISLVADRLELEQTILQLDTTLPHRDRQTLDLIAHSQGNALVFGGWTIKDDAELQLFCSRVKPHVARYHAIRLIGCGVASSAEGQEGMAAMDRMLDVRVMATTGIVDVTHFDSAGFANTRSLITALRAVGGVVFPQPRL